MKPTGRSVRQTSLRLQGDLRSGYQAAKAAVRSVRQTSLRLLGHLRSWYQATGGARHWTRRTSLAVWDDLRFWYRTTAAEVRLGNLRNVGLLLLVVTAALLPLQNIRVTSGIAIADVTLLAAGAVGVLSRHHRPTGLPLAPVMRNGLTLMAIGGVLGLLLADALAESASLLIRLAIVIVLAFTAVIRVAPSGREVRRLLVAFVVSGAVSGVLSSLGDLTGAPLLNRSTFGGRAIGLTFWRFPLLDYARGADTSQSLATNPNLFGAVSAVAGAIAIILLLEATSRRSRLVLGASAAGLTLGVLFSGSRSSLVALLVACVPAVWRLVSRGLGNQVLTGATIVAVLLLISLFSTVRAPSIDRLLLREDTASSERTAESTILRYQNATRGLERRGWNSLATGSGLRDDSRSKLHDGHLEIWLGLGLVGLVGWLLVCAGVLEPSLRYAGRSGTLDPRAVSLLAIGSGFTANVVVTLFVDTIWNRYIWLLVALAVSLALRPDGAEEPALDAPAELQEPLVPA